MCGWEKGDCIFNAFSPVDVRFFQQIRSASVPVSISVDAVVDYAAVEAHAVSRESMLLWSRHSTHPSLAGHFHRQSNLLIQPFV